MRDDTLRDTMRKSARLAGRTATADDCKYVECSEHTSELEWTHDAFAVARCSKELVQRHVVDQYRRRRHRHARRCSRRGRKSVFHDRREETCVWAARRRQIGDGGCLRVADGDHPNARRALLALADCVRAAVAVEGDLLAHGARENVLLVVALEEREDGVYALCKRGVSRRRRDACALLEICEDGDHAAVASRRQQTGEHRREALAVAPEVLRWWEGAAYECREGQEREVGEGAAGALKGRFELVEMVVVARAGGVERGRLWLGLFARTEVGRRRVCYVFEGGMRHVGRRGCCQCPECRCCAERSPSGECEEHGESGGGVGEEIGRLI